MLEDQKKGATKLPANREVKIKKLKENYAKMMKVEESEYKAGYEEVLREAESLKQAVQEEDEMVRLSKKWIADKDRTVLYLKNHLRQHSFRVQ
jgi:hypothetical protein